jgi:hypothetical protein
MAIEVELHVKTPRTRYRDDVFDKLHNDVGAVLYLCPPKLVDRLTEYVTWALEASAVHNKVRVYVKPLPRSASAGRKEPSS